MSCKPVLNGVLWNLGSSAFPTEMLNYTASAADWQADFNEMKHLGIKKLMLFTGVPQCMTRTAAAGKDLIDFIAGECDRCDMELIIAAGGAPNGCWNIKMPDDLAFVKKHIDQIHERYCGHPSFSGWYIDYEFTLAYGQWGEMLREMYRETVEMCKEKTPDLPVIASPFFNPPTETDIMHCGVHDPQEYYEYWRDLISYSKLDVISLQDNGGQHLSFFDSSITEPYIAAFAKACEENNCRFWGNVETGEFHIGSAREFTDKFGEKGDVNRLPQYWRPVPIDRLKAKLDLMSKYSESNLSWGYQAFYRPRMGAAAQTAYHNYEKYLQKYDPEISAQ